MISLRRVGTGRPGRAGPGWMFDGVRRASSSRADTQPLRPGVCGLVAVTWLGQAGLAGGVRWGEGRTDGRCRIESEATGGRRWRGSWQWRGSGVAGGSGAAVGRRL